MRKRKAKHSLSMSFICNESWKDMPICDGGRFCSRCQKNVYDFRGLTAEEIVQKQCELGGHVCGVYDRSLFDHTTGTNSAVGRWPFRVSLLSFLGLFSAVAADAQVAELKEKQWSPSTAIERVVSNADFEDLQQLVGREQGMFVRGKVLDQQGNPLFRMKIQTENGAYQCETDKRGMFLLEITNLFQQEDEISLQISGMGYLSATVSVRKTDIPTEKLQFSLVVFDLEDQYLDSDPNFIPSDTVYAFQGKVVDEETLEPLIGAQVAFFRNGNLEAGQVTDWDGYFFFDDLHLDSLQQSDTIELHFLYVGYQSRVFTFDGLEFRRFIAQQKKNRSYVEGLDPDEGAMVVVLGSAVVMGCDVLMGVIVSKPEPWHKRLWNTLTTKWFGRR